MGRAMCRLAALKVCSLHTQRLVGYRHSLDPRYI